MSPAGLCQAGLCVLLTGLHHPGNTFLLFSRQPCFLWVQMVGSPRPSHTAWRPLSLRAQHCVSLLPGPRLSCFSPWAEHRTELQSSVQFPTFLTFIIGFKVSDLCRSLSFTRLRLADTSVLRIALCERLDLCFKSLFFLDWKIHVWTSFYQ